jgi:hypothetical protein
LRPRLTNEPVQILHTHYDTLKVARDAPPEVVRAAYRALTLKYHPDRHASNADATQAMALLNSAYDVLSDPQKRREYDEWIKYVETQPEGRRKDRTSGRADWISAPGAGEGASLSRWSIVFSRVRNYWVFYALALIAIFVGSLWYESIYRHRSQALVPLASAVTAAREANPVDEPSPFARRAPEVAPPAPPQTNSSMPAPEPPNVAKRDEAPYPRPPAKPARPRAPEQVARAAKPATQPPVAHVRKHVQPAHPTDDSEPAYTRPSAAPNGEAWPTTSDYVSGYPQRNTNGMSQVTIDNSRNMADAFVKVISVSDSEPKVVRNIFVQGSDRFTVNNLRAGSYELHYQNLDSGALMRSEVFALEESAISSGTRYSAVTLTLHNKPDEGMNTFALSPSDF